MKHDPKNTKVLLLMGGWNSESKVSLSSGKRTEAALQRLGYQYTTHILERNLPKLIAALTPKPDVVFNILHGAWGEDGRIQAILDFLDVKYTHSGVMSSAAAMHKPTAKILCQSVGVPCAESLIAHVDEVKKSHPMKPPYVVKPMDEGSTVGVYIVWENDPPLGSKLDDWPFYPMAMVEKYVAGMELTAGVMGGHALGVLEATTGEEFFTYDAKYAPGGSEHIVPARVPDQVYRDILRHAVAAHHILGCQGISRSDFRYDPLKNELCYLETNTQPGFTPTSMFPDIAEYAGISFDKLVQWMIEDALYHPSPVDYSRDYAYRHLKEPLNEEWPVTGNNDMIKNKNRW